jgi:hypothetical protein
MHDTTAPMAVPHRPCNKGRLPTLIYHKTKNLLAVQLLLGHTRIESIVRYLGIDVDDALEMAERTEC